MRIVEDTIRKKHISEAEMVVLTKFQSTGKRWLSPLGQEMHLTCKHLIQYDKHVRALAKKEEFFMLRDDKDKCKPVNLCNTDQYLHNFLKLYSSNKSRFQESLIGGLLHSFMTKQAGWKNPPVTQKVASFILSLNVTSPVAAQFVSANLDLWNKRQVDRRTASSKESHRPIIVFEEEDLCERLRLLCQRCPNEKMAILAASFDATKTPAKYETHTQMMKIVGGTYPNHLKDIPDNIVELKKIFVQQAWLCWGSQFLCGHTPRCQTRPLPLDGCCGKTSGNQRSERIQQRYHGNN